MLGSVCIRLHFVYASQCQSRTWIRLGPTLPYCAKFITVSYHTLARTYIRIIILLKHLILSFSVPDYCATVIHVTQLGFHHDRDGLTLLLTFRKYFSL